jgi:small conductance mechanosensitive channel
MLQINADTVAHRLTGQAYNWIVGFGPKLIVAIIIFFIGQWIIRLITNGLKKIFKGREFNATLRPFINNLVRIVLQVLLLLALMEILGIKMTVFAAIIAAFGVAAGFALSGTLQNFASGVLIILLKPFSVGDNIKTQGEEGEVTSIRLFYTVVRTFTNTTLIVPNSKLSNEVIFNNTREANRRMDVSLKFNYGVNFEEVKQVCLATIQSFEKGLKEPEAHIGIDKIEPDGYTIIIKAWISAHGFQDTRLMLNEKLMYSLKDFFYKKEA